MQGVAEGSVSSCMSLDALETSGKMELTPSNWPVGMSTFPRNVGL